MELSVIIPFCNEGQNVVFTAQALIEELQDFCEFEIILVDNQSDWYIDCSVKNEFMPLMEGKERPYTIRSRAFFKRPPWAQKNPGNTIGTMFFRKGIVKYLTHDEKQGHWGAKNKGIEASTGRFIMFLDAHCIMARDSVRKMVEFLQNPPEEKIGGVHAYINYMLDSRSLEYRPQKNKFFGYQFCTHQSVYKRDAKGELVRGRKGKPIPEKRKEPYKVCVMSTCGMMCPRSVIDELGPWHPEFGIYCGGEGYMNFKHSLCGYHHWIHPECICWHWAEKRGYQFWHRDYVRNEFISAYVCGGEKALQFCIEGRGNKPVHHEIAEDVREKCKEEREMVAARQLETLEEYFDRWTANPGMWEQ